MIKNLKSFFRWPYLTAIDVIAIGLHGIHRLRYSHPARPDRMISVDPHAIRLSIAPSSFVNRRKYYLCGQITDGRNWERTIGLPARYPLLERAFRLKFEASSNAHEDDSQVRELAESFSETRYKTIFQSFRAGQYPEHGWTNRSIDPFYICIGPRGELLFLTGKHRLALAKAAGLKSIPVRVSARHIQWQQRRDQLYKLKRAGIPLGLNDKIVNHPDLQDILAGHDSAGKRISN